jgi:anti-sigma B factor antagonist
MELHIDRVEEVAVVAIQEDHLDAGNVQDFKGSIAPVLAENTRVLLDLSAVAFMDSAGLGALLSSLRDLNRSGGDLRLCGVTAGVMALFELVRMERIFSIHGSRDEGLQAFDN